MVDTPSTATGSRSPRRFELAVFVMQTDGAMCLEWCDLMGRGSETLHRQGQTATHDKAALETPLYASVAPRENLAVPELEVTSYDGAAR